MRFQFQIKNLMWLVFGSAVLFGIARVSPALVSLGFWLFILALLMCLSAAAGAAITRGLQDSWTQSDEDRWARRPVVVKAMTAACVMLGLAASVGVLLFLAWIVSAAIVFFGNI